MTCACADLLSAFAANTEGSIQSYIPALLQGQCPSPSLNLVMRIQIC